MVPFLTLCLMLHPQGDYMKGHDEQLPYTDSSMRSMYHIRDFEVYRLMQVSAGRSARSRRGSGISYLLDTQPLDLGPTDDKKSWSSPCLLDIQSLWDRDCLSVSPFENLTWPKPALQIKKPIDIFLTHDWPRNIYNYGNKAQLLARKQFLREEVGQGTFLASPLD